MQHLTVMRKNGQAAACRVPGRVPGLAAMRVRLRGVGAEVRGAEAQKRLGAEREKVQ